MALINNFLYELNDKNKIGKVFAPKSNIKNVFIPHSVSFIKLLLIHIKYIITGFDDESFVDNESIKSIESAKDSETTGFSNEKRLYKVFNFESFIWLENIERKS